jgi:predicted PurR-regulated permease PerM
VGTSCANTDPDVDTVASEAIGDRRTLATRRATLFAVVGLSALTLFTLRSIVPAVLLGAWVAGVAEPLSVRIARRFGGRTRAASLLTFVLIVIFALAGTALILPVVSDVAVGLRAMRKVMASSQSFGSLGLAMHDGAANVHSRSPGSLWSLMHDVGPLAGEAISMIAAVAMQLVAFIATTYYLAIDGRRLQAGLERVSPFGAENTRLFIAEFIAVGRGIMLSMGVAAFATAIAMGATYSLIGIPRPLLLTTLTFAAALLPIGAPIIWVPIAAWLLVSNRVEHAIAVTLVGLLVVSAFIDHLLRPYLVRYGRLSLHPLLTFLGLIGGVMAFGAWGVFLGPVLVAMTATAMRVHAQRPILARRSVIPGERVTSVSLPPPLVPAPAAISPAGVTPPNS